MWGSRILTRACSGAGSDRRCRAGAGGRNAGDAPPPSPPAGAPPHLLKVMDAACGDTAFHERGPAVGRGGDGGAGGGEGRNCGGDDGAPAPRPVRDLELYMVNEVY